MAYRISFKDEKVKSTGSIYQVEGNIYFSGVNGITMKVEAQVYHKRMHAWLENRTMAPLVFIGDDGTRCTMTASAGGGDVEIELAPASA